MLFKNSMKKTIAFITTHIINKAVISEYVKLSKVSNCTCLLVVDNTNLKMKSEGPITEKEFYGIKVKCFFFNEGIHNGLNLPWFFENKKADRFSDVMWYNSEYRFYYIRKFFPDNNVYPQKDKGLSLKTYIN
jgi:hypothetical protein